MIPLWPRWNTRHAWGWKPSAHFYWPAWFNPFLLLILLAGTLHGQEYYSPANECRHAVLAVPSHGGSATVIRTEPGRSILLSCAHMFQGRDRVKPLKVLVPASTAAAPIGGTQPRVLEVDTANDLSLIEIQYGPLPYCCPVAPDRAVYSRQCLSVGYDELQKPATMRPADIEDYGHGRGASDGRIYTRQRPYHGRSGGALIDERNGWLVGVVSGYSGPRSPTGRKAEFAETHPGGQGIYGGHGAIVALLRRNGVEPGQAQTPAPQIQPPAPRQRLKCPT